MRRLYPARAHMLGGARHAGVGGIYVELPCTDQLAANDWPLVEVDMLESIDHACDVVQILRRGITVGAGPRIDHVHSRTRCAEIDARTPGLHVVLRFLPVQIYFS